MRDAAASDVLNKTLRGLDHSLKAGLLTGVATSVCQSNIDELLTEDWLKELISRGVHYVWYHTFRPVGPKPNFQLALRPDQLVRVRQFVTEMRAKLPIAMIDAYYDGEGQALCPMSTGMSHHISPRGDIEPCPIIQFAAEKIHDPRGIYATMRDSAFLKDFRELSRSGHTWLCGAGTARSGARTRDQARGARYHGARDGDGGIGGDDAALQSVAAR